MEVFQLELDLIKERKIVAYRKKMIFQEDHNPWYSSMQFKKNTALSQKKKWLME